MRCIFGNSCSGTLRHHVAIRQLAHELVALLGRRGRQYLGTLGVVLAGEKPLDGNPHSKAFGLRAGEGRSAASTSSTLGTDDVPEREASADTDTRRSTGRPST